MVWAQVSVRIRTALEASILDDAGTKDIAIELVDGAAWAATASLAVGLGPGDQ